ncbi:hypothetical protein BU24DRAFT_412110 [Aaosphaeria arxii CBS 175.79]|uniref:Extracellular membrane protein CFEM domain-containing protein n=1 Tax=Aaosphaeria arxii CBS 175.79 TaxID=1450172 RepID=A0A6A5XKF1_9PLEO|nr:uncharacterized protein BU24DRAFT_412110 [Aaosphaeria arxii CBS 175.79]KAF2012784.1 hypothetical protein BU24DRAFT_412110 [Aaosphaeria arxii CBS 175.79]
MIVQNLLVAFTLSALGLAQEIDNNDIPRECNAVCSAIVTLARDCDRQFNDDDRGELNCICSATNSNTQLPICEACVSNFDNDRNDNDVNDLLRSCNFSTTTYNPSAASATAVTVSGSSISIATSVAPTGASATNASGSSAASAGTTANTGATQATQAATSSSTGAAAPAMTMAPAAGFAAMGVVGIAMGMM